MGPDTIDLHPFLAFVSGSVVPRYPDISVVYMNGAGNEIKVITRRIARAKYTYAGFILRNRA